MMLFLLAILGVILIVLALLGHIPFLAGLIIGSVLLLLGIVTEVGPRWRDPPR